MRKLTVACKEFWIDTGKRCAWTFAQALLGCMTVGQAMTDIAWKQAFSIALVASFICFLKQVVVYTEEDRTAQAIARDMKKLCDYQAVTTEEPEDAEVEESEVVEDGEE